MRYSRCDKSRRTGSSPAAESSSADSGIPLTPGLNLLCLHAKTPSERNGSGKNDEKRQIFTEPFAVDLSVRPGPAVRNQPQGEGLSQDVGKVREIWGNVLNQLKESLLSALRC